MNIISGQPTVNIPVHHHDGSQAAGTYAAAGIKGELTIRCTLAVGNPKDFLKLMEDVSGTFYITSSS